MLQLKLNLPSCKQFDSVFFVMKYILVLIKIYIYRKRVNLSLHRKQQPIN